MNFEKLKQIIADQLSIEEDTITIESSITEDLGADSLDVVDLISEIEDAFDISIPDEAAENIKTVGDMVNYVDNNAE